MSFAAFRTSPSNLYLNLRLLKFSDIVLLENILLYNLYHNRIPENLQSTFAVDFSHDHRTRAESICLINHPSVKSTGFGLHSVRYHSIKSLNEMQLSFRLNSLKCIFMVLNLNLKKDSLIPTN